METKKCSNSKRLVQIVSIGWELLVHTERNYFKTGKNLRNWVTENKVDKEIWTAKKSQTIQIEPYYNVADQKTVNGNMSIQP